MNALDFKNWSIRDRDSSTRISVLDSKGRQVAAVPRRPDDADIANAITALPDLIDAATMAYRTLSGDPGVHRMLEKALDKARGVR